LRVLSFVANAAVRNLLPLPLSIILVVHSEDLGKVLKM